MNWVYTEVNDKVSNLDYCKNLVSRIACKLWEKSGKQKNRDLEFWTQAENEIRDIPKQLLKLPICPVCKESKCVVSSPVLYIERAYICRDCKIEYGTWGIHDL